MADNRYTLSIKKSFWKKPKVQASVFQLILFFVFVLIVFFFVYNFSQNAPRSKIKLGFNFLFSPGRFEIGENVLNYTATESVLKAFLVGIINTIRVSFLGIILTTILGTIIALGRISKNLLVSKVCWLYVETVRNIPLLLQMLFWYTFVTRILPFPQKALTPLPHVFLTSRGIYFPSPVNQIPYWLAVISLVLLVIAALVVIQKTGHRIAQSGSILPYVALMTGVVLGPLVVFFISGGNFTFEYPELKTFNFRGGGSITPEFIAVLVALTIYMSGFTSEIIRSGILGVSKGQYEAAKSIGLSYFQRMRLVIFPQALRIIIPPLTSNYLSLTKSSSLAVAVGYSDVIRVSSVVISEYGRAVECITIIMLVYLTLSLLTAIFMNWYNKRIAFEY